MKIELFLQTELIRAQVPLRSFFHCTLMSWRSTSRPWNWHQHQHSAPHTPPRATYQHPDSQYRHEPTIDLQKHTLSYIQPNNAWQFQSFGSAASTQHKLSAAYSRICLAARHSHPYKQAQHDVEFLIQSYVSLGYPYKPLRAMAARMLSTRR